MKRLSQSGSSNFCPELRKNALLISQSFANHCPAYDCCIFSENKEFYYNNEHTTHGYLGTVTEIFRDKLQCGWMLQCAMSHNALQRSLPEVERDKIASITAPLGYPR